MKIKTTYIDHMGDDLRVVNAARVSFGNTKKEFNPKDIKLIKYLADHKHMSPFEHNILTVKIECPLPIRSQIQRHRTFSYNEISRRYTDKGLNFHTPTVLRKQSESNKQASYGAVDEETQKAFMVEIEEYQQKGLELYEGMIASGICREQAREILPQGLMTEFYMTGNLRNWNHFIELRIHEHAQYEVQIIAQEINKILMDKFPISMKALNKLL